MRVNCIQWRLCKENMLSGFLKEMKMFVKLAVYSYKKKMYSYKTKSLDYVQSGFRQNESFVGVLLSLNNFGLVYLLVAVVLRENAH